VTAWIARMFFYIPREGKQARFFERTRS